MQNNIAAHAGFPSQAIDEVVARPCWARQDHLPMYMPWSAMTPFSRRHILLSGTVLLALARPSPAQDAPSGLRLRALHGAYPLDLRAGLRRWGGIPQEHAAAPR